MAIIAYKSDKIKKDSETDCRINGDDDSRFGNSKFKVGDIATDGSFSCRPIVGIDTTDEGFVCYFEGILFPCPEHTLLTPEETPQPLLPLSPPLSAAKYKVGDVATAMVGDGYQFACRRIVRIERHCGPFHYFFEGIDIGYPEEDVVLADETLPKMPICTSLVQSGETTAPQKGKRNSRTSDVCGLSLPERARIVLCQEAGWSQNGSDLERFSHEMDELNQSDLHLGQSSSSDEAPGSEESAQPIYVERSDDGMVEYQRTLMLNYQHYGNSFGPPLSDVELCDELIYWANLGARFVLLKNEYDAPHYKDPKQARKQPMGKDWQNRPHSAVQAQEHLRAGRGVGLLCGAYSGGLICLDIDELGMDAALAACPQLANMPYIAHDGKPGRAKYFFYAPEGTPNNSYGFKINGKRVVFVEILSDGKQAVLPPSLHPGDKRYTLHNAEAEVPTFTEAEINDMWQALVAVCPKDHEAEAKKAKREAKRAKRQAERQARRAKREAARQTERMLDYDSFDWDEFTKEVAEQFDLLDYARKNWSGQTQQETRGDIRINGNGGLLINEDKGNWYCHSDQMGGGPFQLVAYNRYGTDDTSGNWSEILREAAEFAGVAWPVFRRSSKRKKERHWRIPDAPLWVIEFCKTLKLEYTPITLHEVQQVYELGTSYLSEVVNLNDLGAGQWVVQAPTERGKTTAIITQIKDSLIIAVPTRPQVDQIAAKHGLAAIYQCLEPVFTGSVNRFVTTFDSVRKIVARAGKNGVDVSDWTLVIDECHQLAAAAFRKKTGIEPLGACIPLFWRTIALTATPPPSVPFFEHAPLIRFTAPQIMKPLYFATCEDYVNAIKQALKEAPFVECHHNDKIAIRAMIEELAVGGIKALEFSSDTKGDDHHDSMIYTTKIPECDVLFVTSLYDDGFNFFCDKSYILLVTAKSACAPEQIEQVSARIRKQRPLKTILIRKVSQSDKSSEIPGAAKYQDFDYAATLNQFLMGALELAEVENEAFRKRLAILRGREPTASEGELISLARKQLACDGAYLGLKWDGTQFVADRLGIHMTTYAKWRFACNANRELMIRALKPYNFVYHGEFFVKEFKDVTKQSKERQSLTRERLTEEKKEKIKGYLVEIKDFGHAEWILKNVGNEGHNVAEYQAATLMMDLVDTGVTADCAKALILDSTLTSHAVTIIKAKIRLQRMRRGFEQVGTFLGADVAFYRKLYEMAQIGDVLTSEKLDEIFERVLADNEGVAPRMAYCSSSLEKQKSKRIRLMNRAFGTKRKKVTVEYVDDEGNLKSKRVDYYQIVSLSPIELEFETESEIAGVETDSQEGLSDVVSENELEMNQLAPHCCCRTKKRICYKNRLFCDRGGGQRVIRGGRSA